MKETLNTDVIVSEFLDAFHATIASQDSINEAVVNRHVFKTNKSDLETYKADFDSAGNKKPTATFEYHDEKRVQDVRKRYLRADMCDREVIAFDACYFEAGRNALSKYVMETAHNKKLATELTTMMSAVSLAIAHELRDNVGFQSPNSYTTLPTLSAKISELKTHPELITLQIITAAQLAEIEKTIMAKYPHLNHSQLTSAEILKADPNSSLRGLVKNYEKLKSMYNDLSDPTAPVDKRINDFLYEFKKWRDNYHQSTFRLTRWASPDPTYAFWHTQVKPFFKSMEKQNDNIIKAGKSN